MEQRVRAPTARAVAFRKKVYDAPDALQADLDGWMAVYNDQRRRRYRLTRKRLPAPQHAEPQR
jgi:hypothetical protein